MLKTTLSKLNFSLGRNPIVEKRIDWRKFIPEPYESVLLISADFELAWAWRYSKSFGNPIEKAKELALRERKNIPGILKLCEEFNIPVTWATVGHLFLGECNRVQGKTHIEIPEIQPYSGKYWDFTGDDWFEHDPCTNLFSAPEWYGRDLVENILKSSIRHEIASHSFSHIDCSDGICSPELFRAELQTSKLLAKTFGIELNSFVYPGNTVGNINVLKEEGFTSFRSGSKNILGYPKKYQSGLWEFSNTFPLTFRKDFALGYQQSKYIKIVKRAIESNTLCVLWFHPSFEEIVNNQILPALLEFINSQRSKIWITTHSEYAKWLNRVDQ